jgi:hypothetical protein
MFLYSDWHDRDPPAGVNALTPRKEKFCRRYVASLSAAGAARAAGYKPQHARSTAYKLLRDPLVQARIADLQAEEAKELTRASESLVGKLESLFRLAVEYHHFSTAVRIIDLQAKLSGVTTSHPPRSGTSGSAPLSKRSHKRGDSGVVTVSNDNDQHLAAVVELGPERPNARSE